MTRINAFLLILVALSVVYFFSLPTPAPLTEQEKEKIVQEIEWSGYGDTFTAKLPIIEIPKNNPFFRVVRVYTSGARNGYHYVSFDFSIDVGKIIRENYHRQ